MKTPILYFALIPIFISSCKKKDLPETSQNADPSFYINANINGLPFSVEAGKDNYYMYSSHYLDTSNVYVYKGELKQNNCAGGCGYSFAILINDYKVSQQGSAMYPDSAIRPAKYFFNDGTPEPLEFEGMFTPLVGGTAASYTWTYSDGLVSHDQQGKRKFRAGQAYSITLAVDSAGFFAQHTNVFRVGSPLQANVSAARIQGTTLTYNFTGYSTIPNANYYWDFGNGAGSTSISPSYTYPDQNFYTAKLKLVSGSEICESYYQVPAFYNYKVHANYNNVFAPLPNLKRLSTITFVVTDPSGNVYSSSTLNQPTDSKVEIISVENYKNNTQNEPTKKVKIKFNCQVKNGLNSINITNGEAVIAVSYH